MRYFEGHTGFVQAVAFSPDGRHLASGGADGTVRLWDVVTAGEVARLVPSEREEWVGAVAFSPDGKSLAVGGHDGRVSVWDVGRREPGPRAPWEGQGRVTALGYSPDGDRLFWGSYEGGAWVHLPSHAAPAPFRDGPGQVYALRVAPDGRTFATGGTGPELVVRRVGSGREAHRLAHGDRQGCWSVAYAPDGRTLAAALGGGVQLWDLGRGAMRGERADHGDVVSGVTFSPDGGRLLTGGWDGVARLSAFDLRSGEVVGEVGRYDWKVGRLFDVAVSPDGTLAAAGGDQPPYLVVWDVE